MRLPAGAAAEVGLDLGEYSGAERRRQVVGEPLGPPVRVEHHAVVEQRTREGTLSATLRSSASVTPAPPSVDASATAVGGRVCEAVMDSRVGARRPALTAPWGQTPPMARAILVECCQGGGSHPDWVSMSGVSDSGGQGAATR